VDYPEGWAARKSQKYRKSYKSRALITVRESPVFAGTMRSTENEVPSCNVNNAPFSVNVSRRSSLRTLINDRMLKAW